MNYADSEKIHMILMSAGLRKVVDPVKADIVIMNTCSVRQKGEDRVFGFMNEIARYHKGEKTDTQTQRNVLFGITGCMVRKSGIARRYLRHETREMKDDHYKRKNAEKITLLSSIDSLCNYDDELFLRSPLIDFTFRIEEVSFVTKILSLIAGEEVGNDAKFNEYLQVKQLQENPASANVIIQTGCDNYCTFCIVPHTRGREVSRLQDQIVSEIEEVVKNGTKEVTLLGQNVNSYGKETKAKLWDETEMKWITQDQRPRRYATPLQIEGERKAITTHSRPTPPSLGTTSSGTTTPELGTTSSGTTTPELGTTSSGTTTPSLRDTPSKEGEWKTDTGIVSIEGVMIRRSEMKYKDIVYSPNMKSRARALRKAGNLPEVVFWNAVKQKQFYGFDFDRQKIIGSYIADFYSKYLGLIIEIDGSSHHDKLEYDRERQEFIEGAGIRVLRFTTRDVMGNMDAVLDTLKRYILQHYTRMAPYFYSLESGEQKIEVSVPSSPSSEGVDKKIEVSVPYSPSSEGVARSAGVVALGFPEEQSMTIQTPFRELLDRINDIPNLDRIRFTSSNPHDMTHDILSSHFDLPKLCPYLHFALQSGSDSILKRMNRKHSYADFKSQVDYLRSRDPFFSISTDIIVGFPGETEEEFQMTARAMRECQFDFAFVARYSARTGTTATNHFEDDISPEEKARRWTILNDLLRETVHTRNTLMVGREEEILISGEGKDDTWVGRTRNFKEVFIPKLPLEKGGRGDFAPIQVGDLVKVKITEGDGWVLKGEYAKNLS